MKTKQFLFTLISLLLITACTTDDSILNDETITLKQTNQQVLTSKEYRGYHQKICDKLSVSNSDSSEECLYNSYTIYYPSSPYWFMSNYRYAIKYRAILMRKTLSTGCLLYDFPNITDIKCINGIYLEKIKKNYVPIFEPGGIKDDIEL